MYRGRVLSGEVVGRVVRTGLRGIRGLGGGRRLRGMGVWMGVLLVVVRLG